MAEVDAVGTAVAWVTVIVVNYNSGPHLAHCLRALSAQTRGDFAALVVDNASSDNSLALAQAAIADSRIRYILPGRNLGFAAANNLAAAEAESAWLATLNPDAFPDPGWLAALNDATKRYPGICMFGSTQIDAADERLLDGAGDVYGFLGSPWRGGYGHPRSSLPPEGETFSPCAAAALYRTDAFREAAGFDERYFCYVEDVDLGFRLRLLGGTCVQLSQALVRHVGGGGGSDADFAHYHGMRNNLWTFVKDMPGLLFWGLFPAHLAMSLLRLASAYRRGQFGPIWRGFRDGLYGVPAIWRARRDLQRRRRVGVWRIARALCWSLDKFRRRDPVRLSRGVPTVSR